MRYLILAAFAMLISYPANAAMMDKSIEINTISYLEVAPENGYISDDYLDLMDDIVVKINVYKDVGGDKFRLMGCGSGVLTSNKTVLTASHVVNKADLIHVQLGDGSNFVATISKHDITLDIAFLDCKHNYKGKYVKFAKKSPTLGKKVYMFGFEIGTRDVQRWGTVTGRLSVDMYLNKFFHYTETDVTVNPGMSGGPVLNVNGRICGIITIKTCDTGRTQSIFSNLTSILWVKENK